MLFQLHKCDRCKSCRLISWRDDPDFIGVVPKQSVEVCISTPVHIGYQAQTSTMQYLQWVASTNSMLKKKVVEIVIGLTIHQVSGLRWEAEVQPSRRSMSGIGVNSH